jgi:hypothetical protein
MISPPKKKSKNKDKYKDKDKDKEIQYKTNLYQNETNYSLKLSIIEGKLQIYIKSSKSFSDDIIEYSNTYSFRQLQIVNKYFSNFNDINEVCYDLDKLLKLKVIIEDDEKDKTLILKIPTSTDKSSGDIIFKLMKTKKVKKVKHSSREKLKSGNNDIINKKLYETNIPGNDNSNLLLGNINDLTERVRKLEKKEMEKDRTINKLKEEMNNYQEKLNSSYNYPIYSPLAKKPEININLADDKNNNISQIIKHKNEDDDDDDIDINFDTEKTDITKDKKKKKKTKNKSDSSDNDDEDDSSESGKKKKKKNKKKRKGSSSDDSDEKNKKKISNGKEDSDEDKSKNIILKSVVNKYGPITNPQFDSLICGFPIVPREEKLKEYINSRIFYTIKEMQFVKWQITRGQKNLHPYFDLLYRATVDGDSEQTFDTLCRGKYPQIILFFTQEGARFGVYVDKERVNSFFKKEENYKEIPGSSFLFGLNKFKAFRVGPKELGTDNRPEKLCFGRTYYYNNNESNWLIYIPNNNFLNVDLKFGDKESSYQNATYSDIVGNSYNYHLKDVEIFQVMLEDDGTGININNNAQKKKKEKIEKIEEEKDEEEKIDMNKIYHDDTVISQIKENEEKNKDKVKIELSKVGVNEDEEENV